MPPAGVLTDAGGLFQNLGLVTFTLVLVGLLYYLLYAMTHPESV